MKSAIPTTPRCRSRRKNYVLLLVRGGGHSAGDDPHVGRRQRLARRVQLRHVFVAAHHAGADSGHRRFRIRNLRHPQTLVEDGYDRGHYPGHRAGAYRVPARVEQRAPANRQGAHGGRDRTEPALRRDIARRYGAQHDRRAVERGGAPVAGTLLAAVQRGAGLRAETPAVDDSDRDRRLHAQRPARRPFWSRRRSCSWWGVCCW